MSPLVLEKPVFTKDQVVSATEASKSLSAIRKRAKRAPQFIADHNDIDTVIIDYAALRKCTVRCSICTNLRYIASLRIESSMVRMNLFRLRTP